MDWRKREHRPKGYNDAGHAHESTFSWFHRIPFLSRERCCEWLAEAIAKACDELHYQLWAYVFMPDHVHLIVCPEMHPYEDGEFLSRVKEPVSRAAIGYLRKHAPQWLSRIRVARGKHIEHHFWQPGRGFDRNIDREKPLLNMIDYIHENPVRKEFVERVSQWKWSSAGWFEGAPTNDLLPDKIPHEWLNGS